MCLRPDSCSVQLNQPRKWWDEIIFCRPSYGYFANPSKTWLIVKSDHLSAAKEIFRDTGVKGGRTLHPRIFAEAVFMQNYSKTTCADF